MWIDFETSVWNADESVSPVKYTISTTINAISTTNLWTDMNLTWSLQAAAIENYSCRSSKSSDYLLCKLRITLSS